VEYAQQLLEETGLGRGRLEIYEIAASDAPKWVATVKEMTQRVQAMGPNPLGQRRRRNSRAPAPFEPGVER
jgi:coenzyme F420-reducing hydrogenase delta subunit